MGVLLIGCIAMSFCFGAYYGQKTFIPQTKYIEVIRTINTPPDIIEREVIVEKEIVVEKVIEIPIAASEFASLEELENWLANDYTDGYHYIVSWDESITLNIDGTSDAYKLDEDCDDYAIALQRAALEDGYLISVQLDYEKLHALNSTFIGNEIYLIEPQTDRVWLGGLRD